MTARNPKWLVALMLMTAQLSFATANAEVRIGDTVPRVETRLLNGPSLRPEQLRNRVVLTVFWATWCPICINELPDYQTLYDRYHSAGFEILALSVDDDPAEVRQYLRRAALTFPVAMRSPALKSAWGAVQGTPLLFLSDRAGIVRVRHLGAPERDDLEREIKSLLNEPIVAR